MKVELIRLESSGGHWIRDILKLHPDIEVTSYSFPQYMGENGKDREYPDVPVNDVLCVVCRDATIQAVSVRKHGYNSLTPDRFTLDESLGKIKEVIWDYRAYGKKVVFISYETVLVYRELYLASVFSQIGVSEFGYDFDSIVYEDGNVKYMKETE